jgi:class 3 adenylate cyclase
MIVSHVHWTAAYVAALTAAMVGTLSTLLLSFRNLNVNESAVQYVLYSLCRAMLIYSTSRWIFYVGVLINWNGVRDYLDGIDHGQMLGVHVVYGDSEAAKGKEVILVIALLGDILLLCSTFWIITMAFEMTRLIRKSMDRGAEKERKIMRNYNVRTYCAATAFATTLVVSAFAFPKQEETIRTVAFDFQLLCVWISFVYPLGCTLRLSKKKRSRTVVSPLSLLLYQRIKRLVIVYCVLVFPSCVVETLVQFEVEIPIVWIGISQLLFYLSGAGTAFVIGASVTCCYRTLQPIMPSSVYEHLLENGYFPDEVLFNQDMIVEPPTEHPVFVFTDIEGSTALWATMPEAMAEAQSLHDDTLRRELLRFRGYEITTVGDAFQLAFHTISDAIAWCIDIQEKLLRVDWPRDFARRETVDRVHDAWGRLIFNGLRVRMAIHVGDDKLVCAKHPVTGKMTYLGVSEIVARELGDMGRGGEIIMSDSALSSYLEHERNDLIHKVHSKFHTEQTVEPFASPDLQISFPIHRVIANTLGDRFKREKECRSDIVSSRLVLLRGRRE